MARLQIFLPGDNVISHELAEETVRIGRAADNDLQVDDGSVSSHHAELRFQDGKYILRDLDSTNGTMVNEIPVTETELKEGDRITFGYVEAIFGTEIQISHLRKEVVEPKEAAQPVLAGSSSRRPPNFVSTSPVPKSESTKDPVRVAAFVIAGIATLVALVSIICAHTLIETPTFPAP